MLLFINMGYIFIFGILFCVCGICFYACPQEYGHTCMCRYTCNCVWLYVSMFVAVRGCHWMSFTISFHLIFWGRVSWLNSDLLDLTSLASHLVPNRDSLLSTGVIGQLPYLPTVYVRAGDLNASPHALMPSTLTTGTSL